MQARFEQLVFHPDFLLKNSVQKLTESDENSGQGGISLLEDMIRVFKLVDPVELSIISVITFRAVFDWGYENPPEMFRQIKSLINEHHADYRVPDTGASPTFLPPATRPIGSPTSLPRTNFWSLRDTN
jgi:hypothetical protein